jgi:iron complex outermembrane receptor protein
VRFFKSFLLTPAFVWVFLQNAVCAESLPKEDTALFEELPSVYDASKYDQKLTKAPPASMGVVTADEIKKYGYRTFGDIISSLKGFYNTNDRAYGYVGARGFGIPSDYNTRVLLLIDGHRFNDAIYDSFDSSEGFPVDVDMIERVEVVRGPSSSLYGTSAFFGVINIITKRGRDQAGTSVKASYGTNDAYKTSISAGNRFNNGLEAFLTGTFYDSQGYNKLYYQEFDNPANNNGIYTHNDEEQAKKLLATVKYNDFTLQGLYVKRVKDLPTASFDSVFNSPITNTSDASTFIDLKYDHTFANQLNLQTRISYNNYRYTSNFPYDSADQGNEQAVIVSNKDLGRGQWWRAETNLTKRLWDEHKITVGAEFQHNFDQFQSNYDTQTHLAVLDSTYKWALLIQDDYRITEKLTLNTGVRLDYFSNFGQTVNPRAGLIYTPWDKSVIKFLYGSAFRAPSQYEQNYAAENNNIPNPNLTPEKLITLELIVEQQFNNQLRAEVNFFHTNINDIIVLTDVYTPEAEVFQQQNVGNVDSLGAEAQLEGNWQNGWQGRLSYSWQETRDNVTHERLTNSPEHIFKLNLIAPLWNDKVFVGFETQAMSGRKAIHGDVDAHVINNLTVFTQHWIKGVELSAGAYNLFDQRYFDPASHSHVQNGIQQDGLTFRIKASMDF